MPAQVGALDVLVLLVAILVGLALGALVAWASLLLRTGHGARPMPGEGATPVPPTARGEAPRPRTTLVAIVLALMEMALIGLILSALTLQPWLGLEDEAMGLVLLSSIVLVMVLITAVGERRGARR